MTRREAVEAGFRTISLFVSSDDQARIERTVRAGRTLYGLLRKTANPSPVVFIDAVESLVDCLKEYMHYRAMQEKTKRLQAEVNALEQSIVSLRDILDKEENLIRQQWENDIRQISIALHQNIGILHSIGKHLREISLCMQQEELACMMDRKTMQAFQKAFFETTVQYYAMLHKIV